MNICILKDNIFDLCSRIYRKWAKNLFETSSKHYWISIRVGFEDSSNKFWDVEAKGF